VHTIASDGVLSPREAVDAALAARLSALAITDHDSMEGVADAQAAASDRGIEIVPGVEISCSYEGQPVHLLAYWPDPSRGELGEELARISESRRVRAQRMVARLRELGYPITLDRVMALARGGNPGRPHVARALMEAGVIETFGEAFTDEFIGTGGRADVEKYALDPHRAVRLVRESGGVPVLAHPGPHRGTSALPEELIRSMARAGLAGIEADHIEHPSEVVEALTDLADRLGMVATAGSDCHGIPVRMGRRRVSLDTLESLRARRIRA